jgi:hypothetical protein
MPSHPSLGVTETVALSCYNVMVLAGCTSMTRERMLYCFHAHGFDAATPEDIDEGVTHLLEQGLAKEEGDAIHATRTTELKGVTVPWPLLRAEDGTSLVYQ